jgi:N-acetylmuramoyl-L-alanine amidase
MQLTPSTYAVIPLLAPLGSKRRPGRKSDKILFLVAHDTGNPGASATAHAKWYRNDPNPPPGRISSAHLFVDDREVIETVPSGLVGDRVPETAFHVLYNLPTDNQMFGADANNAAIGVELCYGGSIMPEEAYSRYVWTLATLCVAHKLDPKWKIVGHDALDPKRKRDPTQGLNAIGKSFDRLIDDVVTAVAGFAVNFVDNDVPSPQKKSVAKVHLNVRSDRSSSARKLSELLPGEEVAIVDVQVGKRVYGIDKWCNIICADGRTGWCWAGGLA